MSWKTLKSRNLVENQFLTVSENLCQKSNGQLVEHYYIVERKDVIVIATFTTEQQFVLIKQYRYPVNDTGWEIAAGYIEEGEKPEKAAVRELLEETGYQGAEIIALGSHYASSGVMNNTIHFFLALNADKIQAPQLDPHEEISVHLFTPAETKKLLKKNAIKDLASAHGLNLALQYLEKKQKI